MKFAANVLPAMHLVNPRLGLLPPALVDAEGDWHHCLELADNAAANEQGQELLCRSCSVVMTYGLLIGIVGEQTFLVVSMIGNSLLLR